MKGFINKLKQLKAVRFFLCFIRIPLIYLFLRGHIRKKAGLSVDAKGLYVPWLTYPMIDYLENLDTANYTIFEFGSGASTLWWARKAKKVIAVEMEKDWCDQVKQLLPDNADIYHCPNSENYPDIINSFDIPFDVIVVDGAERYRSAQNAISKLTQQGIIILDNSDWYPNTAKLLVEHEFVQIDFYGFTPNNSFPHCSSLFFKHPAALSKRTQTFKPVIGGKQIPGGALDDG
ncbi:MAG: class I SAM-dependent methyltransferase [Cyanobacteria bacterium Co-bin8]|nr:class I SAM-dependent methyltransferase [Cyanobacteria bacterium Co-bin8]